MKIDDLNWDSEFFKLHIGKIVLDVTSKLDFYEIKDYVSASEFDLVYIFSKKRLDGINPIDQKRTYIWQPSSTLVVDNSIVNFVGFPDTLYDLAYQAGHKSRFKLDSNISESDFRRLYRLWIDNSLNGSFADHVKVYMANRVPIGFITAKKNPDRISIGLIAVNSEARGKGIGKRLMASIMDMGDKVNLPVEVVTQADNIGACRFYESLGFVIKEESYIYHFWNSKVNNKTYDTI